MKFPAPPLSASLILVCLAACSALGPSLQGPARLLDPVHDDLTGMLVAFDLPRGIGVVPDASTLSLMRSGSPVAVAMLVEAEADDVATRLPPPAKGRQYYLVAVSAVDRAELQQAQAAARAADPDGKLTAVSVAPRLCVAEDGAPGGATVSVLAALPGKGRIVPLVDHRPLSEVAGATGSLPRCS